MLFYRTKFAIDEKTLKNMAASALFHGAITGGVLPVAEIFTRGLTTPTEEELATRPRLRDIALFGLLAGGGLGGLRGYLQSK